MSDISNSIRARRNVGKKRWLCFLCHPEGREFFFDKAKEWYLKDMHMQKLHMAHIVNEAVKKYMRPDDF